MVPATQRKALRVLAGLCDLSLEARLGQLQTHLGFLGEDQTGRSLGTLTMNNARPSCTIIEQK
jgi:hypothetical protein